MLRAITLVMVLACAGCSALPSTGTIPAPPPAVHGVTYIRVPSDDKALTQCIREKRAAASKSNKWKEYAGKLERLQGIDGGSDQK